MKKKFDYERKMWGTCGVDLNPKFLGATRLKYALAALKQISKGKVLEVGCGGGAFTRAIKRHRPELKIVGCDISQKVLAMAEEMGGGVNYQQADVYKLPFKDESFKAIVSFDVWEHLEKPEQAFKEAFRVLKPEGTFHFFVPIEGNRLTLYQLMPKKVYETKKVYTGHRQSYTKDGLFKLLSEVGFGVKEARFSCFYFYQLIDLAYFNFLRLRGRNAAVSVEGYLQFSKGSFFDKTLTGVKTLFGWMTYMENEIFRFLPGGGIHITAIKLT